MADTTTRAYTLRLSATETNWRESLWRTHCIVNRGTWIWGDWLLTLRGSLPASLAAQEELLQISDKDVKSEKKRRGRKSDDSDEQIRQELETHRTSDLQILLALSWLSVESPASLVPASHIVARGCDASILRNNTVLERFRQILSAKGVTASAIEKWVENCRPALTAEIRDDAVWVDRAGCFSEMAAKYRGLDWTWATKTFFNLVAQPADYFAAPNEAASDKDFVQAAGGWFSRNWGSGKKSDKSAVADRLLRFADHSFSGESGEFVRKTLFQSISSEAPPTTVDFKTLKKAVGWKGRPSKGAMALEKLEGAERVDANLWASIQGKLREEAAEQQEKSGDQGERPAWMTDWRTAIEAHIGIPFRTSRDLIWEFGVMLDHALRRVSAGHTWIKRAEASRREFQVDAAKIQSVPPNVQFVLNQLRDDRTRESGAKYEYLIRRRAIDGWPDVVARWGEVPNATAEVRVAIVRDIQADLDDDQKFGDGLLFEKLAQPEFEVVWKDAAGKPNPQILRDYADATVACFDQSRFKVPAYRHPDPLRNPVFVDFGDSRWDIEYSALKLAKKRNAKPPRAPNKPVDESRQAQLSHVTLGTWTGSEIEQVELQWSSKRLRKDLDLVNFDSPSTDSVVRADRLGRSQVDGRIGAVRVASVFDPKVWSGRLQVNRRELDRLADALYGLDVDTSGGKSNKRRLEPNYARLADFSPWSDSSNDRASRLWGSLRWLLSFSAKLQPAGPWLDYIKEHGLSEEKHPNSAANAGRGSQVRLHLARLPGLRILSLDLGHRYAAACTVWQTVSSAKVATVCAQVGIAPPETGALFLHVPTTTDQVQRSGKRRGQPVVRMTIYRRIGGDTLPDGRVHPAPWARLDRQFVIKLAGEERPARQATRREFEFYNAFRQWICLPPEAARESLEVKGVATHYPTIDRIHSELVKLARRGIRRHGDFARIAYAIAGNGRPRMGHGTQVGAQADQNQDQLKYLTEALVTWHELAASTEYSDAWVTGNWELTIVAMGGPTLLSAPDEMRANQRKARRGQVAEILAETARLLSRPEFASQRAKLVQLWAAEWEARDQRWRLELRALRSLILRLRLPRSDSESFTDGRERVRTQRDVGGLSLRRLNTIRSVYQLLKAFKMRPIPTDLNANIPAAGDRGLEKFGDRILERLDRQRTQRIRQLASRIIEAALGVGSEDKRHWDGRSRPRTPVASPRFAPCHAVVIENLEHYRPEDSRLRKENRQLMDWAAGNVRKLIVEGCELHGLYFDEVSPKYTSRQDSRTGAPGIRCEAILASDLIAAKNRQEKKDNCDKTSHLFAAKSRVHWLSREMSAMDSVSRQGETVREDLMRRIAQRAELDEKATFFVPKRGGEFFISAHPESSATGVIQADFNAAANIGLRALTDPDWRGGWWYVLVDRKTSLPAEDKFKGSTVWEGATPMFTVAVAESGDKPARSSSRDKKSKGTSGVYVFDTARILPLDSVPEKERWQETKEFWPRVEAAVVGKLKVALFGGSEASSATVPQRDQ